MCALVLFTGCVVYDKEGKIDHEATKSVNDTIAGSIRAVGEGAATGFQAYQQAQQPAGAPVYPVQNGTAQNADYGGAYAGGYAPQPAAVCPRCGNTGYTRCPQCGGFGRFACPTCGGTGYFFGQYCGGCGGSGALICSYCSGSGAVQCFH